MGCCSSRKAPASEYKPLVEDFPIIHDRSPLPPLSSVPSAMPESTSSSSYHGDLVPPQSSRLPVVSDPPPRALDNSLPSRTRTAGLPIATCSVCLEDKPCFSATCTHPYCPQCFLNMLKAHENVSLPLCQVMISDSAACGKPFSSNRFDMSQIVRVCRHDHPGFEREVSALTHAAYIRSLGWKTRKCPNCKHDLERGLLREMRVTCSFTNCKTTFCWTCLNSWKGQRGHACGNADCSGKDPVLEYLARCGTKEWVLTGDVRVRVPEARLCPHCGNTVYEHIERCKMITTICPSPCKGKTFCFHCLRTQCTSYDPCVVAPRQTQYPN